MSWQKKQVSISLGVDFPERRTAAISLAACLVPADNLPDEATFQRWSERQFEYLTLRTFTAPFSFWQWSRGVSSARRKSRFKFDDARSLGWFDLNGSGLRGLAGVRRRRRVRLARWRYCFGFFKVEEEERKFKERKEGNDNIIKWSYKAAIMSHCLPVWGGFRSHSNCV